MEAQGMNITLETVLIVLIVVVIIAVLLGMVRR
jgi:hypothetical protein